ncbi:hypothetical protein [Leclercia adecarboxylata]|uniref:hypothetical protein n=1 Tax=Leclercia adecarboxylata TaxID=83655 RepID=UPI003D98A2F7
MRNEKANDMRPDFSSCQNISGYGHRTAGRDYIEHQVLSDIRIILLTESKEQLDARSIENERFFFRRFKFRANSVARKKLITFQTVNHFTDNQIFWLQHSGLIHIKDDDVSIKSSLPLRCTGWFFVSLLTLVFLAFMWAFLFSPHLSTTAGITLLGFVCFYVACMYLIDKTCLQPSRWMRNNLICSPATC